jgi:hypothetical protein
LQPASEEGWLRRAGKGGGRKKSKKKFAGIKSISTFVAPKEMQNGKFLKNLNLYSV